MSDLRQKVRARARKNEKVRAVYLRVRGAGQQVRYARVLGAALPLGLDTPLLPGGRRRVVVLLADGVSRDRLRRWLRQFPGNRVHVLSAQSNPRWAKARRFTHHAASSLDDINDQLKLIGPVAVLVDLRCRTVEEHRRTWRVLFFHLKPGGAYLVDHRSVQARDFRAAVGPWVTAAAAASDPDSPSVPGAENRYIGEAAAAVVLLPKVLLIKKRYKHLLKLRDDETNHVLPAREPAVALTELATLAAGELVSRATVVTHEAAVEITGLPERMAYPPMHLRHYEGKIAFVGGTLMHTGSAILPEAFRQHLRPNPSNPKTVNSSASFARLAGNLTPTETLEGTYYQLDPQYTGHFGHIMTEVVSRMWGWDAAKQQFPDLKVLFRAGRNDDDPLERRLCLAYGIADEDIVAVDHPVYVTSLVSATVMWHNADPFYVHPGLVDVWDRIGAGIADPEGPRYERIFVSRTDRWWRRSCRNAREVEQLFESRGFTVIYPESLDVPAQAAVFAGAKVIAGFAGSAMCNLMYAKHAETVILLSQESYTARNEHLYTSLLGCTAHYFWSPADIPRPARGFSVESFNSSWEFDFERNQKPIEELLDSL